MDENQTCHEQLLSMAHAFRQWGLDYSVKFQLIYGTPITGYAAPAEVTVPYVRQIGIPVLETIAEGIKTGEVLPGESLRHIPITVNAHYHSRIDTGDAVDILANHILNVIWQSVFGSVMLEINHHLDAGVGDTATFLIIMSVHN